MAKAFHFVCGEAWEGGGVVQKPFLMNSQYEMGVRL